MLENKAKKYLLTALVLVLVIAAASGVFIYISKNTLSPEELMQIGRDIQKNQNSDIYYVSTYQGAGDRGYPEKLLIGIDDINDEKIEAFKKDWPDLPYDKIELLDSHTVGFAIGT